MGWGLRIWTSPLMRHMHASQQGYAVSHSIGMRIVNGTSHKLKWVVDVVVVVTVVFVVVVVSPGSRGVVGNPLALCRVSCRARSE